jgi:hypothetical protein
LLERQLHVGEIAARFDQHQRSFVEDDHRRTFTWDANRLRFRGHGGLGRCDLFGIGVDPLQTRPFGNLDEVRHREFERAHLRQAIRGGLRWRRFRVDALGRAFHGTFRRAFGVVAHEPCRVTRAILLHRLGLAGSGAFGRRCRAVFTRLAIASLPAVAAVTVARTAVAALVAFLAIASAGILVRVRLEDRVGRRRLLVAHFGYGTHRAGGPGERRGFLAFGRSLLARTAFAPALAVATIAAFTAAIATALAPAFAAFATRAALLALLGGCPFALRLHRGAHALGARALLAIDARLAAAVASPVVTSLAAPFATFAAFLPVAPALFAVTAAAAFGTALLAVGFGALAARFAFAALLAVTSAAVTTASVAAFAIAATTTAAAVATAFTAASVASFFLLRLRSRCRCSDRGRRRAE